MTLAEGTVETAVDEAAEGLAPTEIVPDSDNPDFSKAREASGESVEVVEDDTDAAGATPGEPEEAGLEDEASTETGLLTADELAEVKANPALAKLYKQLNRSYTQGRQESADGVRLLKALNYNPKAAIIEMAKRVGLNVQDTAAAGAESPGMVKIKAALEDSLGADLAGKLMPAFQELAAQVVADNTKVLSEKIDSQAAESALNESQAVVDAFNAENPDAKKLEPRMLLLSSKILPGEGMTEGEYLRYLYRLAKMEGEDGDRTKEAVERIQKSARTATTPRPGVPSNRVAKKAPEGVQGKSLVREAVRAAMRGERWED